jgi:hypothetical protein
MTYCKCHSEALLGAEESVTQEEGNEQPRGIEDRNTQERRSKLRGIHHPAKAG